MSEPTINVNLKRCRCQEPKKRAAPCEPGHHRPGCGGPILVPCQIPRTIEFTVRVGECACGAPPAWNHIPGCPARPVNVTCTISGDGTWAGSEVEDGVPIVHGLIGRLQNDTRKAIIAACRDLWALVKALVTGVSWGEFQHANVLGERMSIGNLFTQRDAVYAALAAMARAEKAVSDAVSGVNTIIYSGPGSRRWAEIVHEPESISERVLLAYVTHVIEQVGALGA